MTLEKFFVLSKSILCISVAASILVVTPFIINRQLTAFRNDVTIQLNSVRTDAKTLINTRADSLQSTVVSMFDKTNERIGSVERNTFILASDLRKDSFNAIGDVRKDLFAQVDTLGGNLNTQVGTLNTNLNNQMSVLNGTVVDVTKPYKEIPAVFAARFDRQTDCDRNALCWQNLTTDTLTNFRFTGRDLSAATKTFNDGFPVMLTGFQTSVSNFASITTNINRLTTPKWYDRLLGYGLNGVMIYRNLNPATNVVVKSTQFLTAH